MTSHPYPDQYTAPFRLRDGTTVTVRPLSPEDEPLIVELHAGHSERTIRMRFFSLVKTLSAASLARLCNLDYGRDMALVAVARTAAGEQIWGVARYYLDGPPGEAEFALVVGDAHQRRGLGRHLMQRLIAVARERGVRKLFGEVLRENGPMLALMRSLGFRPASLSEADVVRVELDLNAAAPQR